MRWDYNKILRGQKYTFGFHMKFFQRNSKNISTTVKTKSNSNAVLKVNQYGAIRQIILNRPAKRNALNDQMWRGLTAAIRDSDSNDSVKLITISGHPDYFCAGTDLTEYRMAATSKFSSIESSISSFASHVAQRLKSFTGALIECRKPIVALVQGQAVGVGVTMLPLCDIVYASDKATFSTPFTSLGLVQNCSSSYTFPKLMGHAKASSLFLMNERISASQALEWGLVTQVFPLKNFDQETSEKVEQFSQLPIKSLIYSKELVRSHERGILNLVNEKETKVLETLIQGPEIKDLVQKFFMRKLTKYMQIQQDY